MTLSVYAKKCNVPFEELKRDAYGLLNRFDGLSTSKENRFTKKDIKAALEAYKDGAVNYPRDTISKLSGIPIKENKRNYRTQPEHIKVMNAMKRVKKELGEKINDGRPKGRKNSVYPKAEIIKQWKQKNPNGKKIDCHRDTGITRPTIDKWW